MAVVGFRRRMGGELQMGNSSGWHQMENNGGLRTENSSTENYSRSLQAENDSG